MSQSSSTRSHTDTYVDHAAPKSSHGRSVRIKLRGDGTSNGRRGLIFFPRPFPHDVTINQATLRLYLKGDWPGINNITVKRITDPWKENRATWNLQPAASDTNLATIRVVDGHDGDEVTGDITDLMADVSAGDDYHGLRLTLSEDNGLELYASDSPKARTNPKLDVEWGQQPYPPSNLSPGGEGVISIATPILTWRFTDHRGSTKQGSSRVQISGSADFSSPLYDSGKVANTAHRWNLVGETTIPDASIRFWRVMVWDQDDFASGWSNAVTFGRVAKDALTITNPPVSPGNQVDDLTPPLTYTFAGTQERMKSILSRVKANGNLVEVDRFEEQVVETGFDSWTPKRGAIHSGATYRWQLYVWDDRDRVSTPGDPAYTYAQRDFTYVRDGTPDPVTVLNATPFDPTDSSQLTGPLVRLDWTRAVPPDKFVLRANNVEVAHIEPADVQVTSTTYSTVWCRAISGVATTYEMEAVVNRKNSDGNDTDTATTKVTGKWLVDPDDGLAVHILGREQASIPIAVSGTTYRLPGNRRPVRITDSVGGHEGPVNGTLDPGVEDDFLELMGRDKVLRYIQSKTNIPVRLGEGGVSPDSSQIGNYYVVATEIFQVDEFFAVEGLEQVNDE